MTATTTVVHYALVQVNAAEELVASVIDAEPTAATLLLNCPPTVDSQLCVAYSVSVTFGAWAQATPPPAASVGTFDLSEPLTVGPNLTLGLHCEMARTTLATLCFATNFAGPNADGSNQVATITSPDPDLYDATMVPVTITAGLEKLITYIN